GDSSRLCVLAVNAASYLSAEAEVGVGIQVQPEGRPSAELRSAGGGDHGGIVGCQAWRGKIYADLARTRFSAGPRLGYCFEDFRECPAQKAVAGHATDQQNRPRPQGFGCSRRLAHQGVHNGLLITGYQIDHLLWNLARRP